MSNGVSMTNNLFITMLLVGGIIFIAAALLTIIARQSDNLADVLAVGAIILLIYTLISIIAYASLGSIARRDACRTNAATLVLKDSPNLSPSDLTLVISRICK